VTTPGGAPTHPDPLAEPSPISGPQPIARGFGQMEDLPPRSSGEQHEASTSGGVGRSNALGGVHEIRLPITFLMIDVVLEQACSR
jgi:hypothetical protein